MSRKVLLVHFHFPPDGLVGSQITAKLAKYLPEHGWEPYVLTARQKYYEALDPTTVRDVRRWDLVHRTRMIPHPRHLYVSLKRRFRGAHVDAHGPAAGGAPAAQTLRRFLRDLITLPDDVTGWIPPALLTGYHVIRRDGIHRIFSSGPPWTNHLVGYGLRRLTGLPWIACFEDPWTPIKFQKSDRSPAMLRLERRLERSVVRRADRVICLNDRHRAAMVEDFAGLPPEKFITISNGYDGDDFEQEMFFDGPPKDRLALAHVGTIYHTRTARHLFAAVAKLVRSRVVSADDFTIRLIGRCTREGAESSRSLAAEFGVADIVEHRGPVPRDAAIRAMYASHILLLFAHDWRLQVPAKTYEYLRVGRPILALAPDGATADLLRSQPSATVVDPYDVDAIVGTLERYVDRFRNGQSFDAGDADRLAMFDRRHLTEALVNVLTSAGPSAPTPRTR